jgi:Gas vesicle synthesis protein GvpL/GvpF
MADQLHYLYGIVPSAIAIEAAPAGIDGRAVELVQDGESAALASRVDADVYGGGVDERLADVAWLAPRATAHDAVLTWASDLGAVVPLPLLSLFRSEHAVRTMLAERGDELRELLTTLARGREYGVRIFRVDGELRQALSSFSASVAAIEADVAAAHSPGQAYLLARKLDAARKDELQRVAGAVAAAAYNELAAHALAATQDTLPKSTPEQTGAAVLNASFLVAHGRLDEFRAAVTTFIRDHTGRGFRLEFTGPWPPYHFARGAADVR